MTLRSAIVNAENTEYNIWGTTYYVSNLGNDLTSIISASVYEHGRDYASALAWVMFGVELVVIGVYMGILKLANKHYE